MGYVGLLHRPQIESGPRAGADGALVDALVYSLVATDLAAGR